MSHPSEVDVRLHVSVALLRDGRLLLVQEEKPENLGKWNLPGGHLEIGESVIDGALREALEETGLAVTPTALAGVYRSHRAGYQAARFVVRADADGEPIAGDQILAVRWFAPEEVAALPGALCVGALKLVAADAFSDRAFPLDVVRG